MLANSFLVRPWCVEYILRVCRPHSIPRCLANPLKSRGLDIIREENLVIIPD